MTESEEKLFGIVCAIFIGFLFGYLFGIMMCKKMPERFGIVTNTETSCCCECDDSEMIGCETP